MILGMAPLGVLLLRNEPAASDEHLADLSGNRVRAAALRDGPATTLREALHAAPFWLLAFGFFVCGFTMAFANTHFMAFADDMGMQPMMAADVVAVTAVFSVAGTIGLGLLADRHDRPRVLALTYALRGIAFILLLLLPADALMFVYAVVLGVSWSATTPLTAAISGDMYGHANLGLIFGVMYVSMNAGNGIGAFLDGVVYDLAGDYRPALMVNVVLGLAAALAAFLVSGRGRAVATVQSGMTVAETEAATAD
jgi:MFS family permease